MSTLFFNLMTFTIANRIFVAVCYLHTVVVRICQAPSEFFGHSIPFICRGKPI